MWLPKLSSQHAYTLLVAHIVQILRLLRENRYYIPLRMLQHTYPGFGFPEHGYIVTHYHGQNGARCPLIRDLSSLSLAGLVQKRNSCASQTAVSHHSNAVIQVARKRIVSLAGP